MVFIMRNFYPLRRIKYRFGLYCKRKNTKRRYFMYIIIILFILSSVLISGSFRLFHFALIIGEDINKNDVLYNCSKIASVLIEEKNIEYTDVFIENINKDGKVNSISTNFTKINPLKSTIEENLSKYFNSYNRIKCDVPVGTILSNDIFAAWGFNIPVTLLISSDAEVEFFDSFTDAGVNQTKYSIMIRINVSSKIHTAAKSVESVTSIDIPLCETIIVGDVPEFIIPNQSVQ